MGHSKTPDTYVLVETAAGYCLVLVKEWSAVTAGVAELREPSRFKQVADARGFYPFADAEEALRNIEAISRGEASPELVAFLTSALPSKKKKYQLGLVDNELAKALTKHDLNVFHGKDVFEVIRMCRAHLKLLVASLDSRALHQFQIGLGHSFSRSKIAQDPARQDKHCQQAVAAIELNDKSSNQFGMKLKEWYGWHFPELLKLVVDNRVFAQVALHIGRRSTYDVDDAKNHQKLLALLDQSESLCAEVEEAFRMTMGQDIVEMDWINIKRAAEELLARTGMKETISAYLSDKMRLVAPNLQALVGDQLGGKLITQAGSVTNLAKAPSSTIQILGAEKALFRALKSRGPTPKYGLIYNAGCVAKAPAKNKGRISRFLANKIALASRMDAFGENTGSFGQAFKQQVEDRLSFLMDGTTPKKNLDVMREAAAKAIELSQHAE